MTEILNDAASVEAARHSSEVRWCIHTFYPDGQKMKAHFELVEKKRGKPATDKLRDDVRKAWAEKRA